MEIVKVFLFLMAERNTTVMIVVDQACVSTISEKIIVLFAILPLRNSASVVSEKILVLYAILPLRHSASVVRSKVVVLFAILPLRRSASVGMVSESNIVSLARLIYSVYTIEKDLSARPVRRKIHSRRVN